VSFSEIWHRRLRYMLSPQLDLYDRIGREFCAPLPARELPPGYVQVRSQPSVLDYGCGLGFGMLRLAQGSVPDVIGVDTDHSAIEFARSVLGNLFEFYEADALAVRNDDQWIRIKSWGFNVIAMIEVIEHISIVDQEKLIREVSSSLLPGGTMVVSTPNMHAQFRKHEGHIGMHCPSSLVDLMRTSFDGSVQIQDFMGEEIAFDSTVSPLVAVCREPRR